MRLHGLAVAAAALIFATATAASLGAQGLNGQLAGMVVDADGRVAAGAVVTVTSTTTNWTRDARTGPDGLFAFVDLVAGTYDLTVVIQAFKTASQKGIVVAS